MTVYSNEAAEGLVLASQQTVDAPSGLVIAHQHSLGQKRAMAGPLQTQGRLPGEPIAIIDIGSNSVRLVIFEHIARVLTMLFNEKLQAGLGFGVSQTGRLEQEAIERALGALRRFKVLAANAAVAKLHVIATAAVRDAENGHLFLAEVEALLGVTPSLLSGREEAHYAALGVMAGIWRPEGLVADMGGGSLDIVDISTDHVGAGETYPLGGLRLSVDAGGDVERALDLADACLAKANLSARAHGKALYLIGGTWRSLAKLHMAETKYPLKVMQNYRVEAASMAAFCRSLISGDFQNSGSMRLISKNRRALLPYGAAVLERLIHYSDAEDVVLSAYGVREGYLFASLDPAVRGEDPLLASCQMLAQLRSRCLGHIQELDGWLGEVARLLDLDQSEDMRRLRQAVCLIADIGWRGHPDHRAQASLTDIVYGPLAGLDHSGRAFLALTIYYRYAGLAEPAIGLERQLRGLLTDSEYRQARIYASAMRLGYLLSASLQGILGSCRLVEGAGDAVMLRLPARFADLQGERLKKRSAHFSREINRPVVIDIG